MAQAVGNVGTFSHDAQPSAHRNGSRKHDQDRQIFQRQKLKRPKVLHQNIQHQEIRKRNLEKYKKRKQGGMGDANCWGCYQALKGTKCVYCGTLQKENQA